MKKPTASGGDSGEAWRKYKQLWPERRHRRWRLPCRDLFGCTACCNSTGVRAPCCVMVMFNKTTERPKKPRSARQQQRGTRSTSASTHAREGQRDFPASCCRAGGADRLAINFVGGVIRMTSKPWTWLAQGLLKLPRGHETCCSARSHRQDDLLLNLDAYRPARQSRRPRKPTAADEKRSQWPAEKHLDGHRSSAERQVKGSGA